MTCIRLAFFHQINEIVMPSPDNLGIFHKSFHCQYLLRICVSLVSISLCPKALCSSKCRYSTSRTQSGASQYHNILAPFYNLSGLLGCRLNGLVSKFNSFNSLHLKLIAHVRNHLIHSRIEITLELVYSCIDSLTIFYRHLNLLLQLCGSSESLVSSSPSLLDFSHQFLVLIFNDFFFFFFLLS